MVLNGLKFKNAVSMQLQRVKKIIIIIYFLTSNARLSCDLF